MGIYSLEPLLDKVPNYARQRRTGSFSTEEVTAERGSEHGSSQKVGGGAEKTNDLICRSLCYGKCFGGLASESVPSPKQLRQIPIQKMQKSAKTAASINTDWYISNRLVSFKKKKVSCKSKVVAKEYGMLRKTCQWSQEVLQLGSASWQAQALCSARMWPSLPRKAKLSKKERLWNQEGAQLFHALLACLPLIQQGARIPSQVMSCSDKLQQYSGGSGMEACTPQPLTSMQHTALTSSFLQ